MALKTLSKGRDEVGKDSKSQVISYPNTPEGVNLVSKLLDMPLKGSAAEQKIQKTTGP